MEPASVLLGRPLVFYRIQGGASTIRAAVTKDRDSGRYEEMDPAGFRRRVRCEYIDAFRAHGGGADGRPFFLYRYALATAVSLHVLQLNAMVQSTLFDAVQSF